MLLLAPLHQVFPKLKHLWGDSHYGGSLIGWLKTHLGWTIEIVRRLKEPARGVLAPIGEEPDWEKLFPSGFRPLPRRWVIERTFAWIGRNRRMSKDYEYLPATSEAWVYLSMLRVMLKRVARVEVEPTFHYRRVA